VASGRHQPGRAKTKIAALRLAVRAQQCEGRHVIDAGHFVDGAHDFRAIDIAAGGQPSPSGPPTRGSRNLLMAATIAFCRLFLLVPPAPSRQPESILPGKWEEPPPLACPRCVSGADKQVRSAVIPASASAAFWEEGQHITVIIPGA